MLDVILNGITRVAVAVASGLVTTGLAIGLNYLRSRFKDNRYMSYLNIIEELTKNAVLQLEQTTVKKLKSKSGTLTSQEIKELGDEAVRIVSLQLPEYIQKFFDYLYIDTENIIKTCIEKSVYINKLELERIAKNK